jgi:Uma2 family endonuclease
MRKPTQTFYKKHLTDVLEWQKMGKAGIFPPESHLELINGEIIEMAPIGSHHASHLKRLINVFSKAIGESAIVTAQDPLQLGDLSEPEPDFMLLRPRSDFYSENHPTNKDVFLLIEVSDSSLDFDQNTKLRLYAMHNIAEYWLLNVKEACLEVYLKPHNGLYTEKTTLRSGDKITLSQLKNISIDVANIL